MDLETVFANGVTIETLAGQIFFRLHIRLANELRGSDIFRTMSEEEDEHAKVLMRQWDRIRLTPIALAAVNDSVRVQQESLITELRHCLRNIDDCPPTLDDAVRLGLRMEKEVEKVHERAITDLIQTAGALADETIAFEAITFQESAGHAGPLLTLAERRGIVGPDGP